MEHSVEDVGSPGAPVGRVYRKSATIYDDITGAKNAMASLNAKLLIVKRKKANQQHKYKAERKKSSVCIEDIAAAIVRMSHGDFIMADAFLVQNSDRITWRKQHGISACIEELRENFNSSKVVGRTVDASQVHDKWVENSAKNS